MVTRAKSKKADWNKAVLRPTQQTLDALMNLTLDVPAPQAPAKKRTPKNVQPPTDDELLSAAQTGETDKACQLVAAGANVNATAGNGWTALQYATDKSDLKLVTLLLDKCADINHRNTPTGRAAIHYAAMNDDDAILRLLIDRGADINIRNNDGQTPLYDAASSGKEACVKVLVDAGCDVTAKSLAGKGVIYAAAAGSHGDIAELLTTYPAESAARREALAAEKKAAGEALAGATTVLQEKVTVSRPLVLKAPPARP